METKQTELKPEGQMEKDPDCHVEALNEIFRCFICLEKLRNCHLCPKCSKLCCFDCIEVWLTKKKNICPHCRETLTINDFIKCRWAEEVSGHLGALSGYEINNDEVTSHQIKSEEKVKESKLDSIETLTTPNCPPNTSDELMNVIHSVEFILNEMDKELDEKISLLSRQRLACMSKSKEVSNLLLKLGEMTKKNEDCSSQSDVGWMVSLPKVDIEPYWTLSGKAQGDTTHDLLIDISEDQGENIFSETKPL